MSLANIKSNKLARSGFTIVELLIVVVVIAILAAITIVSYNGITQKANASAAKSVAATWQKKLELYYAEEGRYPVAITSELAADASKSYYIDNSSTINAAPTSTNGTKRVQVQACAASGTTAPTPSTVAAAKIIYYDFDTKASATMTLGTTTATGAGCTNLTGVLTS